MIVDLNTRIWESAETLGADVADQMRRRRREPWQMQPASFDAFADAMNPVDDAVVLGFHSRMLAAQIRHETVAAWVAKAPDKLIGFGGVDPTAPKPLQSIESAREMGLRGIVMTPSGAGFHPSNTAAMSVFEACASHDMPVMIESAALLARTARLEFADPFLLDEAARAFPDLKLILSGFGDPWVNNAIALAAKHPTVYVESSSLYAQPLKLHGALLECHQRGIAHQVLFGSGYPFCTPEEAIVAIYSVNTLTQGTPLPSVPREQLRTIVERDALTILGLPFPQAVEPGPSAEAMSTNPVTKAAPTSPATSISDA